MIKYYSIVQNGCEATLFNFENTLNYLLKDFHLEMASMNKADLVIFFTCTFSRQKEEETNEIIKNLLDSGERHIIVTGCYLGQPYVEKNIYYIRVKDLKDFISEFLKDRKKANTENLSFTFSPVVSISEGCFGRCTYCSIRLIKGLHRSRPIEDIVADIKKRLEHKYIKLVGEDIAGYGLDIDSNLKKLIDRITILFPDIAIRLGSLNIKLLKNYTEEELLLFTHPNIEGNIHIPIQSASDKILRKMQRDYTLKEYESIYSKLRVLGINKISTDLISGFPFEDESDHKKNIELVDRFRFEYLQVFMFEERPGTSASIMPQLNEEIKKQRTIELIIAYLKSYASMHNLSYSELVKKPKIFNTNITFN
ncbi:MAG: radical SAM protein [Bacteroidales bacterium]|nr:radical SAM protein [Bacteroidales bacterium]